jgi:alpha-tubulin suppressor-like RCC1 family protein
MSLRRSAPLILLFAGCHDRIAGPVAPIDRVVSITAVSVVDQTGMVGAAVPSAPTVVVRDASGNPVAGVQVLFDGAVTTTAPFTDSDGIATSAWVLPNKPGSYTVVAHTGKLAPVRFSAAAVVGPPAYMYATAPLDRAVLPGVVLADSVTVYVTDYVDNRLPGVTVTFEIDGPPGATIEHASAVTNEFGVADPGAWTLGTTLGVYTLTARAAGVLYPPTVHARVYEPFEVSTVAAGADATCANALSGVTYCWGGGFALPARIQGDERYVSLTVGTGFACGLTAAGAAFCWGRDVADSNSTQGSVISGLPHRVGEDLLFRRISAGATLVCGIGVDGQTYCWGQNAYGQLGNGNTVASAVPHAVAGGYMFVELTVGNSHACGVTTSGETYCWGANDAQQLGAASTERCDVVYDDYYYTPIVVHTPCSTVPLRVSAVPALTGVSAADATCGLSTDGDAFCWGRSHGAERVSSTVRFANIAVTRQIVSRATPTSTVVTFASMCGTTTSGAVFCGDDNTLVPVAPNLSFSAVVAGVSHQCGVIRDGALVYCWGVNGAGELGDGTLLPTNVPTPVVAP